MQLGGLPVASDVSPGAWLAEALAPFHAGVVGSRVPPTYAAFARVFHPAARYDGDDDVDVEWHDVAALNGTVPHALMQWPAVTGGWEYVDRDSQPPSWDGPPSEGHLPVQVAEVLAGVLARHTGTPDDCWFGRWNGFGWDAPQWEGHPVLALDCRDHLLAHGRVTDATRNLMPEPHEQSANLWWPADRAWVVATDIDEMSTYVGATRDCVAELLAIEGLELLEVAATDPTGYDADTVNPLPPRDGAR